MKLETLGLYDSLFWASMAHCLTSHPGLFVAGGGSIYSFSHLLFLLGAEINAVTAGLYFSYSCISGLKLGKLRQRHFPTVIP